MRLSRWPPSVTCEGAPGASKRALTASATWLPTVRPKRASHADGIGSEFSIVPVATPSAITAPPVGFDSETVNVSPPSSTASSSSATLTVFDVSPAAKLSVPVVAV